MKKYNIEGRLINFKDCSVSYIEYACDQHNHLHDGIEMVFIVAGQGEQIANGKPIKAKRGSLLIMDSVCSHEIKMWETMKYYSIMFRGSFFCKDINKNASLGEVLYKVYGYNFSGDFISIDFTEEEMIQKISELFFEILVKSVKKEKRFEKMVRSRIDIIVNTVLRRLDSAVKEEDNLFFSDVMDYIQGNHSNTLTLKDVAKHFNYDSDYFSKKLKNYCGMSFKQLVIKKKLSDVIYNLLETDEPIETIIQKCGFTNKTYFYSVFEKYYGIKPKFIREYRNNYRNYIEFKVKHKELLK